MFITELHAKGGNGEKFTSYVPSDRGIDLIIRNRINIPGVPTKTKKCLKNGLKNGHIFKDGLHSKQF